MKIFLATIFLFIVLFGCSSKNPPSIDISNAKMALVKAESKDAKTYAADDLVGIKVKYQNLQKLMHEERYDEAKFLAQEIQADSRLLEIKSQRLMIEKDLKRLQGEINLITKEFTQVEG